MTGNPLECDRHDPEQPVDSQPGQGFVDEKLEVYAKSHEVQDDELAGWEVRHLHGPFREGQGRGGMPIILCGEERP